jgi:hypothetical protein
LAIGLAAVFLPPAAGFVTADFFVVAIVLPPDGFATFAI